MGFVIDFLDQSYIFRDFMRRDKACLVSTTKFNLSESLYLGEYEIMPIYEYEHLTEVCSLGKVFEIRQSILDNRIKQCPNCKNSVRKRISRIAVSISKTNSEIRDLGFTKLVKRDNGVYENVTKRDGESRYMEAGKPETLPNFSKTISD